MKTPQIYIRVPTPKPIDVENNNNVFNAAFAAMGEVRIRLNMDIYAPGTRSNPKARYYTLCGSAPTVVCRTPEAVAETLQRIYELVQSLNQWPANEEGE